MNTKGIELYHELRKIDPTPLFLKGVEEKKMDPTIVKHARYIGSAFDESLKYIIERVNVLITPQLRQITIIADAKKAPPLKVISSKRHLKLKGRSQEKFNMHEYLNTYNFQRSFNYGINNKQEIVKCQDYINQLHKNITISNFSARQHVLTNLKLRTFHSLVDNLNSPNGLCAFVSGEIDLILDDKLIEIKADIRINGRKNKYAAQLIFYYFMTKIYTEEIVKDTISRNKKFPEIKTIGIYYASYDKSIEVETKKLFPNEDKLLSLIRHELVYGNYHIRRIIENSMMVKEMSKEDLEKFEHQIIEKRKKLYRPYDQKIIEQCNNQIRIMEQRIELHKQRFTSNEITKTQYSNYVNRDKDRARIAFYDLTKARLFSAQINLEISQFKNLVIGKLKNKGITVDASMIALGKSNTIDFRKLLNAKKQMEEKIESFDSKELPTEHLISFQKKMKDIKAEIELFLWESKG